MCEPLQKYQNNILVYIIRKCVQTLPSTMCPTISNYLRAPLYFAHFLTRKSKNCIFAIFVQIHRLLYSNGEKITFFRHGLVFFTDLIMLQQKLENYL